jgi:hypothetical protein
MFSTEMLIVPIAVLFIILISIQYALNRIVHLLKEIKAILDKEDNHHNQNPPFA